ncbi:MAG TPA: preprotein translocase subunit SecA [Rhizomicrobium sp.]|jgi:preprotein translocase subunit SecA|nr:preprotein translocase subunit SecA [Rhizomicrobium sp.]
MLGFGAIAQRFFGSSNERKLRPMFNRVAEINALEATFAPMTDEELRGMTVKFRERLAGGEDLDDLLPEAFAVVREAAKRTLGQRHFDVQLVGGMVLHDGRIAEMKTGEGKTLVATLPVYLNALAGKGVHVVTVNDYLASRDANWMGQVYRFLGLSVGCIVHGLTDEERKRAYAADVTYGTNNEFGFDYLRDNMKYSIDTMAQRGHAFAIVDEVDSILVDEARTPLIISGPTEDQTEVYRSVDVLMKQLVPEDFELDEKQKTVTLTEVGNEHMVEVLREAGLLTEGDLYDLVNINIVHHVNQALKAHTIFLKDRDYIVKDRKVIIIDEFTGRMMDGRRFSDGLHQALEAKEDCAIQPENVTMASITFQNYFRLYDKLAGMTGTALTEAAEFMDIYNLEVAEIPTNLPIKRVDADDEVYRTFDEKYEAIIKLIEECTARGQPILVGTTSIDKSEQLSELLKKRKVKHNVLNARYHEQEASIVAQAGVSGTVTIATNMAGRGTDIQLGGNTDMRIQNELGGVLDENERESRIAQIKAEVAADKERALAGGGLYIVGTERHESRRIDNQLRGRAGRQGDPGASKFFLSLQDDLMRIFGSERMDSVLTKLGLEKGEAIAHPWVNKALEKAQQKVEARNFEIRKNILKYDNVLNDQRKVVFEQRKEIMSTEDVSDEIADFREQGVGELVARHIPEKAYAEQWDAKGLHEEVLKTFGVDLPIVDWTKEEGIADEEVRERIIKAVDSRAAERTANAGPDVMRYVEKAILLQTLDHDWREHIVNLDHLRQYVGLRGYGQRDPLNEYKSEAFELFEALLSGMRFNVVRQLMHLQINLEQPGGGAPMLVDPDERMMQVSHIDPLTGENEMTPFAGEAGVRMRRFEPEVAVDPNDPRTWGKVQRNAPCPCGSGRKFKHCHGALV